MLAPEVIQRAEKRVGQTLCGKWHLDRVIGVGGMAAVYEATHRNRNRVAIKLLHPPLSLDEGTRHRFLREGYVANTIRHNGAVQILDDDVTEDGIAFLVMELLQGESVEERMIRKGGSLDMQEALSIVDQLLDVLGAAHDQHVVHRDIKPDNLFLTEEGKLKVLDFGIARLHQGDTGATKVGSFMGTPAFCAPEQARGRWDEVDPRTDLFSVGASLFTCLTGTHVHEAETSSEQLALAISASARSLRSVLRQAPQELVELVDKSLAYEKEERFQSARAMRAAVQRVMAGLPQGGRKISAPPVGGVVAPALGQQTELEPESYPPTFLASRSTARNVVLGVVAALGLALLLLTLSRPTVLPGPAATPDGENGPQLSVRPSAPSMGEGKVDARSDGSPSSTRDSSTREPNDVPRSHDPAASTSHTTRTEQRPGLDDTSGTPASVPLPSKPDPLPHPHATAGPGTTPQAITATGTTSDGFPQGSSPQGSGPQKSNLKKNKVPPPPLPPREGSDESEEEFFKDRF